MTARFSFEHSNLAGTSRRGFVLRLVGSGSDMALAIVRLFGDRFSAG
jgi:hypothetical protein